MKYDLISRAKVYYLEKGLPLSLEVTDEAENFANSLESRGAIPEICQILNAEPAPNYELLSQLKFKSGKIWFGSGSRYSDDPKGIINVPIDDQLFEVTPIIQMYPEEFDGTRLKVKVATMSEARFNRELTAKEAVTIARKVDALENEVCDYLYNRLSEKYNLGRLDGYATITSIASQDPYIETFVHLHKRETELESPLDSREEEAYRLLASLGETDQKYLNKPALEIIAEFNAKTRNLIKPIIGAEQRGRALSYISPKDNHSSTNVLTKSQPDYSTAHIYSKNLLEIYLTENLPSAFPEFLLFTPPIISKSTRC